MSSATHLLGVRREHVRVAYLLMGSYGSYTFNGLTVIVSALALRPEDRGVYVGLVTWMTFLAGFTSLGVGPGLANAVRNGDLRRSTARFFVLSAAAQAVPGVVVIVLAANLLAPGTLSTSALGYGLTFIGLAGVMTSDWAGYVAQGLGRTYFYANLRIAVPFAGLAAFLVLVAIGEVTVVRAVGAIALTTWLVGIVGFVLVSRSLPGTVDSSEGARTVFRFGLGAYWGAASSSIASKIDGIVVSVLLGPTSLSVYALAVSLTTPISAAGTAVGVDAYRQLAVNGSRSDRQKQLRKTNRRYLLIAGAAALGMALMLPLLPLVVGSEYKTSVHLGWVLIPSAVAFGYVYLGTYVLQGLRTPHLASLGQLVTGISAIAAVTLFASDYGAMGAAIGTVIGYGLGASLILILTKRVSSRS